jgi:hypothetical protein
MMHIAVLFQPRSQHISLNKLQGTKYTHTMPAPAGATALKNDIPVMDNPFAAPLWS